MFFELNFCICMLFGIIIEKIYVCIIKVFKRWVLFYFFLIIWIIRNGNFIFFVKNMLIEFERYFKISCLKKFYLIVYLLYFFIFFS